MTIRLTLVNRFTPEKALSGAGLAQASHLEGWGPDAGRQAVRKD